MSIFRVLEAVGAITREGICGTASVEDDTEEGGVVNFFQIENADYVSLTCVDELVIVRGVSVELFGLFHTLCEEILLSF